VPLYQDNQDFWASDGYFQQLQNYYLQTPADLSRAVFQTALNWTQSATNEYDAALMLEQHLNNSSQFTYSVSNPPVPSNVDAVDWLLQTHRGYCTYYATAMTIMARLLGMPARVVNGFSQGHYDSTRKAWVVDGTDAHSWVQVYFPGFGWINFDPTPGFSFNGAANPQPIPSPAPTQHRPTPTPTVTGGSTPGKHHTPTPASSGSGGNSSAKPETQGLFLGFSILILLASLFMLLLAIARYRRVTAAGVTTISSIFWRLSRLASLAGMPPQPWQTPYEYTRTLSRHYPQARTPLRRLAELFVRERWAPAHQAPRAAEAEDIEKLWPTLRNSLLRSLFRRLARIGRK